MQPDGDRPIGEPVTFYAGGFRGNVAQGQRMTVQFRYRDAWSVLEGTCPLCGAHLIPQPERYPGAAQQARCAHCILDWSASVRMVSEHERHTNIHVAEVEL